MRLREAIAALRKHYGPPGKPVATDGFEQILFENVAYLVDDETRLAVWKRLKKEIGVRATEILAVEPARLARVIADGGMRPPMRAEKLRESARILLEQFDGDFRNVLNAKNVRAALKKFPGVGDPGADKILMFLGRTPVLAVESNGLRVLLRLGFGTESPNYAASYKSVQQAISREIDPAPDWLIAAHQILRRHGQELCKRSEPRCAECPLSSDCPTAAARVRRA